MLVNTPGDTFLYILNIIIRYRIVSYLILICFNNPNLITVIDGKDLFMIFDGIAVYLFHGSERFLPFLSLLVSPGGVFFQPRFLEPIIWIVRPVDVHILGN